MNREILDNSILPTLLSLHMGSHPRAKKANKKVIKNHYKWCRDKWQKILNYISTKFWSKFIPLYKSQQIKISTEILDKCLLPALRAQTCAPTQWQEKKHPHYKRRRRKWKK